ncbi:MAG TPA: hypothetical protein PK011_04805 [Marinagarivorans sp.]|nr:hypothetical protein [Cellvibrionaceae bacterium]HMY38625.1 hypothetical protein [Marinagarivorans sp.]
MRTIFSCSAHLHTQGFKLTVLALSLALLTNCGGTDQDRGSAAVNNSAGSETTLKGLAIDGHLARAKVYIDSDNNGVRDAWEPFAFTDNEGYFSYNPNSQKNYCASNATAEESQYCLKPARQYDNASLRITGGYDSLTGEPFIGQLSLRLKDVNSNQVISPLSSLIGGLSDSQSATLLGKLGLKSSDLTTDYTAPGANVNGELLNNAVKIHKVASLLGKKIGAVYTALGDENGMPSDGTSHAYQELARALSGYNGSLDEALTDANLLKSVAKNAEQAVQKRYQDKELPLPSQSGDEAKFDVIVERLQALAPLINQLLPPVKNTTAEDARAGARAVEVLGVKAVNEKEKDPATDRAFKFFRDNAAANQELLAGLGSEQADISQLTEHMFSDEDVKNPQGIKHLGQVDASAVPFNSVAGKQLHVADMDLGQKPNNLKDIEFELYFAGDGAASAGSFTACAKYIKKAKADGSLGKGNSRGELIKGFWSQMDNQNKTHNYSLLLTFEFLGAKYQAIMKSVGSRTIDGTLYQALRFDNNDEYRIWYSAKGLEAQTTLPTSSSECQSRLPSRVGI